MTSIKVDEKRMMDHLWVDLQIDSLASTRIRHAILPDEAIKLGEDLIAKGKVLKEYNELADRKRCEEMFPTGCPEPPADYNEKYGQETLETVREYLRQEFAPYHGEYNEQGAKKLVDKLVKKFNLGSGERWDLEQMLDLVGVDTTDESIDYCIRLMRLSLDG